MKPFSWLFAMFLTLLGCAPGPIEISDATSTRMDANAIYGFFTVESQELVVGMENLCRNFDETEFEIVTSRIQDPCGGFENRIVYGTNPFLPEDISRLIKLSDGTLVGIFKFLDSANPRSGTVFQGTYTQRFIKADPLNEEPAKHSFAVYEIKPGVIQYLGHKTAQGTAWRQANGLAKQLAAAVPGLEEEDIEMGAKVTEWECSYVPSVFTSGGTWTCRSE